MAYSLRIYLDDAPGDLKWCWELKDDEGRGVAACGGFTTKKEAQDNAKEINAPYFEVNEHPDAEEYK